jgi:hypothetical protein
MKPMEFYGIGDGVASANFAGFRPLEFRRTAGVAVAEIALEFRGAGAMLGACPASTPQILPEDFEE